MNEKLRLPLISFNYLMFQFFLIRFVYVSLLICLLWQALSFSNFFFSRFLFEGPLEWQESANYVAIFDFANLEYSVKPSFSGLSVIYGPLFYYILHFFSYFGEGFVYARFWAVVVPFCIALISVEIMGRRYFDRRFASAIFAALMMIANISQPWIDLLRQDMWLLTLSVLISHGLLLKEKQLVGYILIGFFIGIAALLKVSFLSLIFVPFVMYFTERRYLISLLCAILLFSVVSFFFFLRYGEGVYFWNFEILSKHKLWLEHLGIYITHLRYFAFYIVLLFLFVLVEFNSFCQKKRQDFNVMKLTLVSSMIFALSALSAFKDGGWYFSFHLGLSAFCVPLSFLILRSAWRMSGCILLIGVLLPVLDQSAHKFQIETFNRYFNVYPAYEQKIKSFVRDHEDFYFGALPSLSYQKNGNSYFSTALFYDFGGSAPLDFFGVAKFPTIFLGGRCENTSLEDRSKLSELVSQSGYYLHKVIEADEVPQVSVGCIFAPTEVWYRNE